MEYSRKIVEQVKHLEHHISKVEKDVFALKGSTDDVIQLSQKIDEALLQTKNALQAIREKLNA